jgi:hypothetical protein
MNLPDICRFLAVHSSEFRTAWLTSAEKFEAGVKCKPAAKTASAKTASAKTALVAAVPTAAVPTAAVPTAVARPDTGLFLDKIEVFETKGGISKYAATKLWEAFVHHYCQDNRSVDTLQHFGDVMVRVAHGKGFFVRDLAKLIGAGSGDNMTRWLERNVNSGTYPSLQAVTVYHVSLYL